MQNSWTVHGEAYKTLYYTLLWSTHRRPICGHLILTSPHNPCTSLLFFFLRWVAIINKIIILPLFSACWVFSFSVIHWTLTWTIGSLTCIWSMIIYSLLCVCINTGVGHTNSESTQHFWLGKTHDVFLVLLTGFKLGSCNVQSNTLPIESPSHPIGPDSFVFRFGASTVSCHCQ